MMPEARMLGRLSIQWKLILVMVGALVATTGIAGYLSYRQVTAIVEDRLTSSELPAQVKEVRNQVERELFVPLTMSQDIATNPQIRNWFAAGEPADGLAAWKEYASSLA